MIDGYLHGITPNYTYTNAAELMCLAYFNARLVVGQELLGYYNLRLKLLFLPLSNPIALRIKNPLTNNHQGLSPADMTPASTTIPVSPLWSNPVLVSNFILNIVESHRICYQCLCCLQ